MNVKDKFKSWETHDIKVTVQAETLPYAVCMMQISGDYNFSTVVRNANAFGAREVYYWGPRRHWDRRGAVGMHNYTDVVHLRQGDYDGLLALRQRYRHFIAADIVEDLSTDLRKHVWQPDTLIFFGEEGSGLPLDILGMCDAVVHIPQMGCVRSINVGTSAGVFMYDYMMRSGLSR